MTDALQQGAAPTVPAWKRLQDYAEAFASGDRRRAVRLRDEIVCEFMLPRATTSAPAAPAEPAVFLDVGRGGFPWWNEAAGPAPLWWAYGRTFEERPGCTALYRAPLAATGASTEPLKTGRTMLERAWDGFQNRNCGKREWRGKAQSKRDAFCNAVLDLLEWITEEADALRAATPQQAAAPDQQQKENGHE